jgi:hypothetical protein
MLTSLKELLEWRDQVPDQSGEEAFMLRVLIARRERELRTKIADLIAGVSHRENWKSSRCAAIARQVEQMPVSSLEAVHEYILGRSEGQPQFETPDASRDPLAEELARLALAQVTAPSPGVELKANAQPDQIVEMHGRMRTLESRVTATPGLACGVQGVRIMRVVALMSQARSARMAKMRVTGTQAIYRHF